MPFFKKNFKKVVIGKLLWLKRNATFQDMLLYKKKQSPIIGGFRLTQKNEERYFSFYL